MKNMTLTRTTTIHDFFHEIKLLYNNYLMKYSIDFIKTKLKADSKQFSYDEIVEIENEIKMTIKH